MYIRTITRKNKGHDVQYVQLAHNYRSSKSGSAQAKILYNFGRRDEVDIDALKRLALSITRFLEPRDADQIRQSLGEELPFEFLGSRQFGATWFLDELWKKLGIKSVLEKMLSGREYRTPVERLLFAMATNRCLAPGSKLSVEHWVQDEVMIDGLPEVEVHQLYRAIDFLLQSAEDIQEQVFFSVADLLNLEVDLLFLDTTTTCFEIEGVDEDDEGDSEALRRYGYSKDERPNHAQAVIAFAVTRNGIPVRCWVWPGNTADKAIVEKVKKDLNGWKMGRVVMVADAGFNSAKNKRILQGAGGHYILSEKLRHGTKMAEALTRQGKYSVMDNGLLVKEVVVGDGEARRRYVVVKNPKEEEKQRLTRESIAVETERRLAALEQLEGEPHKKAACALRAHGVFGRYIRQTKTGKLRIDKARLKEDALLDGKFLLSTSDDSLGVEDIVKGYKQLMDVERCFRDLKHTLDIRPVYHRLSDRIRAHVLLCWLSLLLIRVAEQELGQTWFQIKRTLGTSHVGHHRCNGSDIWMTNRLDAEQNELFEKMGLTEPPKYYRIHAS